jgi:hypothetical protein
MILKEKFRNLFKDHFYKSLEEKLLLDSVDDDLEKIADDYAIEFANWIDKNHKSIYVEIYNNKKKLLEIFKQEKGL